MTLLGVKWSLIASAALHLVDVVEVAGWDLEQQLPDRPQLLHNLDLDFSLAVPGVLDDRWLDRCIAAIARTESPWFSLHLGFSCERVRFADHMLPESSVIDRDTCLDRLVTAIQFAKRNLEVPLLIENLDYCPEGAYEHVCDPRFIAEVVDRIGCDLLLDLAHLQVSADWLGLSPEEYASLLPLDRVVEVHLSSPRRKGGRLDDGHFELVGRDVRLLKWLLEKSAPKVVVLEYTRDATKLIDQLTDLREILGRRAEVRESVRGVNFGDVA